MTLSRGRGRTQAASQTPISNILLINMYLVIWTATSLGAVPAARLNTNGPNLAARFCPAFNIGAAYSSWLCWILELTTWAGRALSMFCLLL